MHVATFKLCDKFPFPVLARPSKFLLLNAGAQVSRETSLGCVLLTSNAIKAL